MSKLKSRAAVSKFIHAQLENNSSYLTKEQKANKCWHYGRVDLRSLMDFLYDGPPETKAEEIKGFGTFKKRSIK